MVIFWSGEARSISGSSSKRSNRPRCVTRLPKAVAPVLGIQWIECACFGQQREFIFMKGGHAPGEIIDRGKWPRGPLTHQGFRGFFTKSFHVIEARAELQIF